MLFITVYNNDTDTDDCTVTVCVSATTHYVLKTASVYIKFISLVNWESVFRPSSTEKFHVHSDMNSNVGILRLFPGITKAAVSSNYYQNCYQYLATSGEDMPANIAA